MRLLPRLCWREFWLHAHVEECINGETSLVLLPWNRCHLSSRGTSIGRSSGQSSRVPVIGGKKPEPSTARFALLESVSDGLCAHVWCVFPLRGLQCGERMSPFWPALNGEKHALCAVLCCAVLCVVSHVDADVERQGRGRGVGCEYTRNCSASNVYAVFCFELGRE